MARGARRSLSYPLNSAFLFVVFPPNRPMARKDSRSRESERSPTGQRLANITFPAWDGSKEPPGDSTLRVWHGALPTLFDA